jgi:hypothetical protein
MPLRDPLSLPLGSRSIDALIAMYGALSSLTGSQATPETRLMLIRIRTEVIFRSPEVVELLK